MRNRGSLVDFVKPRNRFVDGKLDLFFLCWGNEEWKKISVQRLLFLGKESLRDPSNNNNNNNAKFKFGKS